MKKQWTILITTILCVLIAFVGCQRRESTKEEVYGEFQKKISKIEAYTCTAEIEAKGNKGTQNYIMIHDYKKPDYYKVEMVSPEHLKGKTMEYTGNKIIIKNPEANDEVELPNIGKNSQYLFIGDFIKNYLQNEELDIKLSGDNLILETQIPGENKYFTKQILYINTKTKNPVKMEILDDEGNVRFNVNYKEFEYKS